MDRNSRKQEGSVEQDGRTLFAGIFRQATAACAATPRMLPLPAGKVANTDPFPPFSQEKNPYFPVFFRLLENHNRPTIRIAELQKQQLLKHPQ